MDSQPGFNQQQKSLWFPVLRSLGFASLKLAPRLGESLAPDFRGLEGFHATGKRNGEPVIFALRSQYPGPDRVQTAARQRRVSFGYSHRHGMPTSWGDFFANGPGTRFYCYGWRSRQGDTLDAWVVVDVGVLGEFDSKGVPLSIGSIHHGRTATFMTFKLRQLSNIAQPSVLVPHHSPGHPGMAQGAEPTAKDTAPRPRPEHGDERAVPDEGQVVEGDLPGEATVADRNLNKVQKVLEIRSGERLYGRDVNEYLARGWMLLAVQSVTVASEDGPSQLPLYVLGWPAAE